MQSSKNSGGSTHIRYGHTTRPRLLEVVCPSCGCIARATKPSEANKQSEVVPDLSPSNRIKDWEVKCLHCPKRMSSLSYDKLPKLFFSGGELDIWAWNSDHAQCVIKYLLREDTSSNPYDWFMTYVHGDWKKKPKKAISELEKMYNQAKHPTP